MNEDLKRGVTEVVKNGTCRVRMDVLASGDDDEPEAVEESREAERFGTSRNVGEFRSERFRHGEDDRLSGTDRTEETVGREVGRRIGEVLVGRRSFEGLRDSKALKVLTRALRCGLRLERGRVNVRRCRTLARHRRRERSSSCDP